MTVLTRLSIATLGYRGGGGVSVTNYLDNLEAAMDPEIEAVLEPEMVGELEPEISGEVEPEIDAELEC